MFHMSISCDKTFLLVPSLRSSVKVMVKYQGHSFRMNGCSWGNSVSQIQLVFHGLTNKVRNKETNEKMHGRNIKFGQDLNHGRLVEKPIP